MRVFILIILSSLFAQVFCVKDDPVPTPPLEWPPTWHTWLVTTIFEEGVDDLLYLKGQLIAYDSDNQYACRYNEQNLLNSTDPRPVDICDYINGYHYTINDTTGSNSGCSGMTKVAGPLEPIKWPQEFLDKAIFMGTDYVAQQNCYHFLAIGIVINDQTVQMDIWTSADTGFPCQMHIFEVGSKIHTNWAFDGFNPWIPPEARTCTAPKVICSQPDWLCQAKPDQDNDSLGQAMQWICDPSRVDCDPINPGGPYYNPDTVTDHSNWAFNNYYQRFKAKQGEFACDFNGAGHLVPPQNHTQILPTYVPRQKSTITDFTRVFSNDIVCPSVGEQ